MKNKNYQTVYLVNVRDCQGNSRNYLFSNYERAVYELRLQLTLTDTDVEVPGQTEYFNPHTNTYVEIEEHRVY